MKKNMGSLDRVIRLALAIAVGILFYTGVITGVLGYVLLAASGVFLLTSIISFCPLYSIVGLNTCKVN